MIYVIPTHQNPTGRTMSLEDRTRLVAFAERHGILVIADEVYHLLDWRQSSDPPRPARMFLLGNKLDSEASGSSRVGGCVSVSSFTKIFAPGIRCGWVEGTHSVIDSLINYGYIQSQWGVTPFVGEVMRTALTTGLADKVLDELRSNYNERVNHLIDKLVSEPRIQIAFRPLGGYFLWIKFPHGVISEELLSSCREKIKFMPGVRCDPAGDAESRQRFASHARLCFADLSVEELECGSDRLVECLRDHLIGMESRD